MKCLFYFGISSMKEGTSAQLSGRGELDGGARVTTLVTLRKCTDAFPWGAGHGTLRDTRK